MGFSLISQKEKTVPYLVINTWILQLRRTVFAARFEFKTEPKVSLSPCYSAAQNYPCFLVKLKQGLRMRQMLLKSGKHNVGACVCHGVTVRLLGIIRIYVIESNV